MFYPDYKREPRNSMKWFVGARRWLDSSKSVFSSRSTISVCPRASSRHLPPRHSFGIDVSLAARFPSCWTLKYYASSTSVKRAGNSRPICYGKKRRGIADSALHYFLSHDSRLCALYISRKTYPCFAKLHGFRKICDATCQFENCRYKLRFVFLEHWVVMMVGDRTKFVILKSILRTTSYLLSRKLWACCKLILVANPTLRRNWVVKILFSVKND